MDTKKPRITYTDDDSYVQQMLTAIEHNDGYCPCRPFKTDETKCMCAEFREQIKRGEAGVCHCGLYKVVTTR